MVSWCQKAPCAGSHLHRVNEKTIAGPEEPWEHGDTQQMGRKGVKTRVQSNGKMIWTGEVSRLSLHLGISVHRRMCLEDRTAEEQ